MIYFKFAGIALSITAAFSSLAQAQGSNNENTLPQGLKWEPMTVVGFNTGTMQLPHASRAEINLARTIWEKEIESTGSGITPDSKMASFILLKPYSVEGSQFVFSIFSSGFSNGCIPPANGRGIEDMYSVCPMRVTQMDSSKSVSKDFPEYCHLYPEPAEKPGEINQSQIAFDRNTMTAYFRIIQHGKHVKSCDRTLRIQ